MKEKASILIVDDDEKTCKTLALLLGKKGYETETAGTARKAVEKLKEKFFNLTLLDIKLPDMEGIELVTPLKEIYPDMDVIIVTGHASLENSVRALNGGASAYIKKPMKMDELLAAIKKALETQRVAMENRRLYDAAQRELAEHKQAEEQLVYMATHDALTGLPNRVLFNDRLTQELAHAQRNKQKLAVMLLDLDYFKDVNDKLGHSVGDKLLQLVGRRLAGLLRKSDVVARMGGDEFLLLLPEIARVENVVKVANKILEVIRKPFVFNSHELDITTSIGIAVFPNDGEDPSTLVKNVDMAMYRAKGRGRDNHQCYSVEEGRDARESQHHDRR